MSGEEGNARYIISQKEIWDLIQWAGDEVRGAHGRGDIKKAQRKLEALERRIEGREIPANAMGFYLIDENGDVKCLSWKHLAGLEN